MSTWLQRQRIAGWLGLAGGILGVLAGLIQATVGSGIPDWSGGKANPVALGLLTIGLSVIGVLCALVLQRNPGVAPERRIAAAVGLLVPGALCFTTVGMLWYLPGVLMVTASVYAVLAGDPVRTRHIVTTTWLRVLISILGACEVLMAVSAGPMMTIAVGIIGGLALMTAPWIKGVAVPAVLLLIGTLPFVVIAWWSVAAPLLAVVALGIGLASFRSAHRLDKARAGPVSLSGDRTTSAAAAPRGRS